MATREEILAAAWDQVRERGLAGLSMRDLAAAVGMRAPSLYSYFASKHAIYDAMFAQGNEQFLAVTATVPSTGDARADMRAGARAYVDFCVADPVRTQLLFQRTIPDFEPSPESYRLAVEALERTRARLREVGATKQRHLDLWTAVISGLVSQQMSNDPKGDRWVRLVDDAVEMFLAFVENDRRGRTGRSTRQARSARSRGRRVSPAR
jgi:AcrR family transcriptional regulator